VARAIRLLGFQWMSRCVLSAPRSTVTRMIMRIKTVFNGLAANRS